ncbi:MAG: phenylalanine--tRNA ligase subunit alpha [Clostridiales bacterium]|nr:phenylalanine--tRNA ligase subunit alpha [Clostridiales bacterium]
MREQLINMEQEALAAIEACRNREELLALRVTYLGKKGSLTAVSRGMGSLSPEERPVMGQLVNIVKDKMEAAFATKLSRLDAALLQARLAEEKIDITLPGKVFPSGSRHIITQVREEIEDIFLGLGYVIAEGPQVELDKYNFEAMNMPSDHPARAMQDSFYFSDSVLLRTHTSPMQARTMEKMAPQLPVKIICPGVVYRRDEDATHSPMFHQIELLLVDKEVTMADLKGTILSFVRAMFGREREIRLRPSYFPFTEPSAEVDISCFVCEGKGCSLCKNTGWIEILGSGMVHPQVLKYCGYDPAEVSGFAAGMGLERISMLKYGIKDIRLLFDNDVRFLAQF